MQVMGEGMKIRISGFGQVEGFGIQTRIPCLVCELELQPRWVFQNGLL